MPTDTYQVEFGRKSRSAKVGYKKVKVHEDIFSDMLRDVFVKETGIIL